MNSAAAENFDLSLPPAEPRRGQTEIWLRYRSAGPGDASEESLVKQYLPLVKTVVGRLAMTLPSHVEEDVLYSAGLVGLLNALRQYDPTLGTTFEPYARLRVRGAILDEIRRMDWTPRSVHAKARRLQTVMSELEAQHGRLPSDAEMAAALGVSPAEYEQLLDEIRPATFLSLDVATLTGDDEELTEQEKLLDERQQEASLHVSNRELARLISQRMEQLPDLQRKILAFHYFEDMRLKEIAQALDFSEAHICQSHAKAILAIRNFIEQCEGGLKNLKDRQP